MREAADQYLGHFTISGRKLPGVVNVKGRDSRLEVFADSFVHLPADKMRTIRGVARSGAKLTILNAIGAEVSGTSYYYGTAKHLLSLFPHYVAVGPRHLQADKKVIAELFFSTSGALDLFYDIGAFGSAHDRAGNVRKLMPKWARKDRREIKFNELFYYVDRGPIVDVELDEFRVRAFNAPSWRMPSPPGD